MRRRRRTSSRSARSPPATGAGCASKASAATRSRATSASSTPHERWARAYRAAPAGSRCERGRWPLRAIRLDCNHIPDAAMTLAVMALYADGTTRLDNIASWRVKETDRIAAMATELRKLGAAVAAGADFIEITPPAALAGGGDPHLRRPPHGDVLLARSFQSAGRRAAAGCRCASSIRAASARPSPTTSRRCSASSRPSRGRFPVITVDGPTASGKGTLAAALAAALGYHYLDSGALYRATALGGAGSRRRRRTTAPDSRAWPPRLQLRFEGGATLLDGRRRHRGAARRSTWASWRRGSRPGRKCATRCVRCSCRSAVCRAWWPTGATWAR